MAAFSAHVSGLDNLVALLAAAAINFLLFGLQSYTVIVQIKPTINYQSKIDFRVSNTEFDHLD